MLDFDLNFEKKNYYLTPLTPRTNQEAPSIMHTDARSIHPSVSEKDTVPALEIIISWCRQRPQTSPLVHDFPIFRHQSTKSSFIEEKDSLRRGGDVSLGTRAKKGFCVLRHTHATTHTHEPCEPKAISESDTLSGRVPQQQQRDKDDGTR